MIKAKSAIKEKESEMKAVVAQKEKLQLSAEQQRAIQQDILEKAKNAPKAPQAVQKLKHFKHERPAFLRAAEAKLRA